MSELFTRKSEADHRSFEWEHLHEVLDSDYGSQRWPADTSGTEENKIHTNLIAHAFRQEISDFGLHVALRMCISSGESCKDASILLVRIILILFDYFLEILITRAVLCCDRYALPCI